MVRIVSIIIKLFSGISRRLVTFYYKHAFQSCGFGVYIDGHVKIYNPECISVGNMVTINRGVILQGSQTGKIRIGNNVTISYSARVLTAGLSSSLDKHCYKDVCIGNNVWVASDVTLLPGVTIEDNIIIGAGAVVTKDLKSGYVYGGIPAKQIKRIDCDTVSN